MGKETAVLEDITDAPPMARHEYAPFDIDQGLAIDDYLAVLWSNQAGDDIDEARLAGAGAAEQCGQTWLGREARIEVEAAE